MLEILLYTMIFGWICALVFFGVAYFNYLGWLHSKDKK